MKTLLDICNWNNLDSIAIEYHDEKGILSLNYSEINSARLQISEILKTIAKHQFIGIDLDIPAHCIPSLMLGILSNQCAFVNLSLCSTSWNKLVSELHVNYIFSVVPDQRIIQECNIHGTHMNLIQIKDTIEELVEEPFLYAYAITTSGSTGISKIVKVIHNCILPNIQDLQRIFNLDTNDVIAQLTKLTFDPSIVEIFLSFSCSSKLWMCSTELKNNPQRLLEVMNQYKVTFIQTTPSVLFHCWSVESFGKIFLNQQSSWLRILLLGGELLIQKNILYKIKHPENQTRIYNIYGITEISCWASIDDITISNSTDDPWYLGEPLSNTILQVRDEAQNVIKEGKGSLYIGSRTRICCLENESFNQLGGVVFRDTGDIVNIDENGKIFYQGRCNKTIKRYGNRLDLNEIDKTLMNLPYVNQSHTIWDEPHQKLHSCLIVSESCTEQIDIKITRHLKTTLSSLHIPDHIHIVQNFRLTSHGKISMLSLQKLCQQRSIEDLNIIKTFETIWLQHLDNQVEGFVKLGGNSITALQIATQLTELFQHEFPELIGMLLNDCTFQQCSIYLVETKSKIYQFPEPNSNNFTSKLPLPSLQRSNKNIPWTKCRGHNNFPKEPTNWNNQQFYQITMHNKYNLEKCIDSSVTLFQYPWEEEEESKQVYATVGSHAGIICTIPIKSNGAKPSFVKLPHRIESSILVVNDFKALVGCYDGKMYCLDLLKGNIQWEFQTGDIIKCTPITNEEQNQIYFGSYDSYIYCLAIKDGSLIWKSKTNGIVSASGSLHSPFILFATLKGSCINLNQYTGKIHWRQDLNDPIFIAPTILPNERVVFCTVSGNVICFNLLNHEKIWSYCISGNVFAYNILTDQQNLIVASQNKHLYCFEIEQIIEEKPRLKWIFEFDCAIFATPWYENDYLIIVDTNGLCQMFDHHSGKILTTYQLPGQVFSSPVVHENLIFLGCRDNHFYTLRIS